MTPREYLWTARSRSCRWLRYRPALADEAERRRYHRAVADVVGPLSTDNVGGYPAFKLEKLADASIMARLEPLVRDLVEVAKRA